MRLLPNEEAALTTIHYRSGTRLESDSPFGSCGNALNVFFLICAECAGDKCNYAWNDPSPLSSENYLCLTVLDA